MSQSEKKSTEVFSNKKKLESQCYLPSFCGCCRFLCFSNSIDLVTPPYSPGPQDSGNLFSNDCSKEYLSCAENQSEKVASFLYPTVSHNVQDIGTPDMPPASCSLVVKSAVDPPIKYFSPLPLSEEIPNLHPDVDEVNKKDTGGSATLTSKIMVTPVPNCEESKLKEGDNSLIGHHFISTVVTSPKDSAIICNFFNHSGNHSVDENSLYPSLSDMRSKQPLDHVLCSSSSGAVLQQTSKRSLVSNNFPEGRTRSLLESRRGSHTSLTLTLMPSPAPNNCLQVPGHVERTSSGGCLLPGSRVSAFSFSALHCRGLSQSPAFTRSNLFRSHLLNVGHSSISDSVEADCEAEAQSTVSSPCCSSPMPSTLTPNIIADREKLSSGSIPLSGKSLQKKLCKDFSSLFLEFWSIPTNHMNKCDFPLPGVCQKNRYPSILPNNETRVILPPLNNDVTSTYINANFISGYGGCPDAFIATQGPMSHTVNDFWRMVWFVRAPVIVMLTKLVERSRAKCELYLPDSKTEHRTSFIKLHAPNRADTVPDPISLEDRMTNSRFLQSARSFPAPSSRAHDDPGESADEVDISRICSPAGSEQLFGSIHVRVVSVNFRHGYTKRQIILKQGNKERTLTHFWCVSWPDHSSPEFSPAAAHNLLNLVFEVEGCRCSHINRCLSHSTPSTPITTGAPLTPNMRRRSSNLRRQHATEDMGVIAQPNSPQPSRVNSFSFLRSAAFDESVSSRGDYRASVPVQLPSFNSGPVVVHCSAGIGRTGCFIALCIGCQQLREENMVDIFGIVSRLRLDRGGMIEDHCQYAFLHIALSTYYSLQRGITPPDFPCSDLAMGFPRPG